MTDGGDGNNNIVYTEERKKNMSNNMIGHKNPMYNKKHKEETKIKISNKKLGKSLPKFTEEHKEKIRQSKIGKKRPDLAIRNANNKGRTFKMKNHPIKECPY